MIEIKNPSFIDGTIRAWNMILLEWDTMPVECYGLDWRIWPEWIRVRDGKRFQTPMYGV